MISGGSRSDRGLRAFANFGRPLRMSLVPSFRSAPEIQACVISGGSAVLAEVRPEPFRFAFMTVSHADDASGRPAGSPDKNDASSVEPTNRHETRLAAVAPIVNACEVKARKDGAGRDG